jgi:hypothetical protein
MARGGHYVPKLVLRSFKWLGSLRKLDSNLRGTIRAFTGDLGVRRKNRMWTKVTFGGRGYLPEWG